MSRARDLPPKVGASVPINCYQLFGQQTALARASHAIRQGRPPQAWLIAGPPGVGKATLAYRIARYLLRHGATEDGPEDLAVGKTDPVCRQIEAGAYPGLMVLTRGVDDKGRMKSTLAVDEVRRLESFFGLTSGAGGWRVAIVDSADDMNDHAANALLKTLEEPPHRGLLILLAHAPGRLLATIRSRCQRLDLRPLADDAMDAALALLAPATGIEERRAVAALSEGSVGLALRLSEGDGLALAQEVQALIDAPEIPEFGALYALAERVARTRDGLADFGDLFSNALARRIRERAHSAEGKLDAWVALWEKINMVYARASGIHMEPRQTVISTLFALDAVRRTTGAR